MISLVIHIFLNVFSLANMFLHNYIRNSKDVQEKKLKPYYQIKDMEE